MTARALSWEDRYAAELRSVVRAAAREDGHLSRWVKDQRLPFLGLGSTSVVFGLGRERVLRVSKDETSFDEADCDIPERILDRYDGQLVGWPRVDDMFFIREGRDKYCIVIVERVRVGDKVRNWNDLLTAVDIVHVAHQLGVSLQARLRYEDIHPSSDTARWARELYTGLQKVGRLNSTIPLDSGDENFGLTRDRHAVWVDFGV